MRISDLRCQADDLVLLFIALMALSLVGCGGARAQRLETQLTNLGDEVSELRRGQAAQRVQFDEFRNRLVMLQDKLDSARVQHAKAAAMMPAPDGAPVLPHVVLPPSAAQHVVAHGTARSPTVSLHSRRASSMTGDATNRTKTRSVTIGPNGVVRVTGVKQQPSRPAPNKRRRGVRNKSHAPAGPSTNQSGGPPQNQSPQQRAAGRYRSAKALLDASQLRAAKDAFTAFLRDHPKHPLADNALYWMGETWYAQSLWLRAAKVFGQVVERYPHGNKVPDAMLKTALCYVNLGEQRLAKDTFEQLLAMYPGTPTAKVAKVRLARLGSHK